MVSKRGKWLAIYAGVLVGLTVVFALLGFPAVWVVSPLWISSTLEMFGVGIFAIVTATLRARDRNALREYIDPYEEFGDEQKTVFVEKKVIWS